MSQITKHIIYQLHQTIEVFTSISGLYLETYYR